MVDPLISIIIPVYNCQEFLYKCYDSIKNQHLKEFEVIFVNDGSSDKSEDIIRNFAANDSRLILTSQKNSGQAYARNKGLKLANGHYIVFVDSDDWFYDDKALLNMYNAIKTSDSDFVQCSFSFVKNHRESNFCIKSKDDKFGERILLDALYVNDIYTSPWAKIYKRDFLIRNELYFPEGLVNEDTAHSILCAACAKKVSFLSDIVYCSREREGSTSRASFKRMFLSMHNVMELTRQKLIQSHKFSSKIENAFYARYERSILYNLLQSAQRNSKDSFISDYEYCIENTDFIRLKKYSKYLPMLHRCLCGLASFPTLFYAVVNSAKIVGYRMH